MNEMLIGNFSLPTIFYANILAVPLFIVSWSILQRFRLYRYIWHPRLFHVTVFILLTTIIHWLLIVN